MVVVERQPAQEARTERAWREVAACKIDGAEMPGAGIQHPEPVVVPARRMRHREFLGDDRAACNIDHDAALGAPRPPAADHVAAAGGRHPGDFAIPDREAVEMAAILGRQPRDEGRLPEQAEGVHRRQQRQARIGGVDEDDAAVAEHADVVDIDLARGVPDARHIIAVGAVHGLAGGQDVLEAPDLERGRQHQALRVHPQPHRPAGADLVNSKPTGVVDADEIEPPGLVGGEGEADLIGAQPVCQATRAGDVRCRQLRQRGG